MVRDNEVFAVVQAIQKVCQKPCILHEPVFMGNEEAYLIDCIKSTFVSSVGPYVTEFEKKIAEYTGAAHAIAVVNGTSGLHLALYALGVNAEHEVLVPSVTFVASANAIYYTGAQPHFIDIGLEGYGIDVDLLKRYLMENSIVVDGQTINSKTGKVIKAVMPVHVFGHAVDMRALLSLVQQYPMAIVEDAAEALGSFSNHQHLGTFGDVGVLSFNGNKTITTGGGGMVLTSDVNLAGRLRQLSTTAKSPHPWRYQHSEMAFNYRMPNINAALGCAQLETLPSILQHKRFLLEAYSEAFAELPDVCLVKEPPQSTSNYWLHNIQLLGTLTSKRDIILQELHEVNIGARPLWDPLHTLEYLAGCPRMALPNSMVAMEQTVSLPSGMGVV